jgi:hypothetical protein
MDRVTMDLTTYQGSCHCGAVRFSLEANSPVPFMHCHCTICRKTAGSGGYAINLGGDAHSLKVRGEKHLGRYHAVLREPGRRARRSKAERRFCMQCGSALWLWDPRWPDLVHPHASAIDTDLPVPPESTHIMLGSKASWIEIEAKRGDRKFDEYPQESIAEWHERLGLTKE